MPLDKLVLVLLVVLVGAAVTVWFGALIAASVQVPALGVAVAIPALLVLYVIWRVVADRLRSRAGDRYDRLEK